jgi:thermolysin
MRLLNLTSIGALMATVMTAGQHAPAHAQHRPTMVTLAGANDLRSWDGTIDAMARDGSLHLRRLEQDVLVTGRAHERFEQRHHGIPVYGGDVSRQTSGGVTVSLFGTIYTDIDVDTEPVLSVDAAAAIVQADSGAELGRSRLPSLVVLPDATGYRLAYRARIFAERGAYEYFIDARSGAVVRKLDARWRQVQVGKGTGVLGDTKKLSTNKANGNFITDDALRPPFIETFDMKGNLSRTLSVLNGVTEPTLSDLGTDADNVWTDTPIVDAHAHTGYVYDYYFKRFGRRGLDNGDLSMFNFVHPVSRAAIGGSPIAILGTYYFNAFYAGFGIMVFGEGAPQSVTLGGQQWNYLAGGLDVVAHELTHGVTDYSSRLIYENESGALNEAFSDMMGTAVEFYFQPAGTGPLHADYQMGEDVVTPGGIRSLSDPGAFGDPDHYSKRLVFATPTEDNDNGGVHTNMTIATHAYYLAIEGGTNRTSGLPVQGVGQSNREQIEKVMYRAFTQLMPASATFAVARAVTIQAARDLYGANSAAERAVTQAWTAVGVN